jgi:hypothetical protein
VVRSVDRYIHSAKIEAEICDTVYDEQEKAKVNFCVKMFSDFSYKGIFLSWVVFLPLIVPQAIISWFTNPWEYLCTIW